MAAAAGFPLTTAHVFIIMHGEKDPLVPWIGRVCARPLKLCFVRGGDDAIGGSDGLTPGGRSANSGHVQALVVGVSGDGSNRADRRVIHSGCGQLRDAEEV